MPRERGWRSVLEYSRKDTEIHGVGYPLNPRNNPSLRRLSIRKGGGAPAHSLTPDTASIYPASPRELIGATQCNSRALVQHVNQERGQRVEKWLACDQKGRWETSPYVSRPLSERICLEPCKEKCKGGIVVGLQSLLVYRLRLTLQRFLS